MASALNAESAAHVRRVELMSDHYYPQRPGPNPTILMRQLYGRDIAFTVVFTHPV
jgi:hypothetical protein